MVEIKTPRKSVIHLWRELILILKTNHSKFKFLVSHLLPGTDRNVLKHLMVEVERPIIRCKDSEREKKRNRALVIPVELWK